MTNTVREVDLAIPCPDNRPPPADDRRTQEEHIFLPAQPFVAWLDKLYQPRKQPRDSGNQRWSEPNLEGLSALVGISQRDFRRYFKWDAGHIWSRTEELPLRVVDRCVTAFNGVEGLYDLYDLDYVISLGYDIKSRTKGGKCHRCSEWMVAPAYTCGFCQEMRGKILFDYRKRELY